MSNEETSFDELEQNLRRVLETRNSSAILSELSHGAWIYGAGGYGRRISSLFRERGIDVLGFIDRSAERVGDVDGIPVHHPETFQAAQASRGTFVLGLMSATDMRGVKAFAESLPFAHRVFPADLADTFGGVMDNYWMTSRSFFLERMADIRKGYDSFDDAESRAVYLDNLRYRAQGILYDGLACDMINQYAAPGLIKFSRPVSFVDGGAFDGDTYRNLTAVGVEIEHWIPFEPDTKNFAKMVANLELVTSRATLFPCGLSDVTGTVSFASDGSAASKIETLPGGSVTTIQCVALDDVLHGIPVDYIKLDVEGAERAALSGMKKTVAKQRPVLAVSAYHRPEDLWEIPMLLKEENSNTRVYLRQHGHCAFDSVAYAIPESSSH